MKRRRLCDAGGGETCTKRPFPMSVLKHSPGGAMYASFIPV
ncbi:MAG: hypothetical protein OSJ58_13035 [Dysosmobacter sp.]|nr:hypothetical protein [Dysosmobacter sp.]